MKQICSLVLITLLILINTPAYAAVCPPVDEAAKDSDLVRLRTELIAISSRKDAHALLAHLDPQIYFSFGTKNGSRSEFIKYWGLDVHISSSHFWQAFAEVLSLGGRFAEDDPNLFTAPYSATCGPGLNDASGQSIVMGRDVIVRSQASSKSKPLGFLNYEIVNVLKRNGPRETLKGETHVWQQIKAESGLTGYIWGKYLRSPLGFRAGFKKENGKWIVSYFVEGD